MLSPATTRHAAKLLLLGGSVALAQSTLPPLAPTSAPNPAPAPNPIANPIAAPPAAHRGVILYARGELTILADNSSLNQILRDIAHQTGMTITGAVEDQRVYGKIGPAPPAEVLTSLLDGAGADMVLRESAAQVPAELILTPRQTGAAPSISVARESPPDPAASYAQPPDADAAAPPTQRGFTPRAPAPDGTADNASAPPDARLENTGTGSPAAGAETPQQVYQRLLQLQRSQPQQPANQQ